MSIVSYAGASSTDTRHLDTERLRARAEVLQFSAEIAVTYVEWGLEVPETVVAEITELSSITYALDRIDRITADPAATQVEQRRQVRAQLRGIAGTDVATEVAA